MLVVDEILTIESGAPLVDYKDLKVTKYVFRKSDGSTFVGVIEGFTHDCIEETRAQYPNGLGVPQLWISIKETASMNDNVETPSVSPDTDV